MKVKTAELIGLALNWAVAVGEGKNITFMRNDDGSLFPQPVWADGIQRLDYDSSWNLSGPIIERERISFAYEPSLLYEDKHRWKAIGQMSDRGHEYGPTPLIAAMRCYVAFKLGDEVEIPDELCRPSDGTA